MIIVRTIYKNGENRNFGYCNEYMALVKIARETLAGNNAYIINF